VNTNLVPKTVSRQSDDLSFACMVMEVKHAPQILDSIFCIFQLQLIAFNHFCQENNLDKPTIVGDRPLHGNVERSRDDTVSHTLGVIVLLVFAVAIGWIVQLSGCLAGMACNQSQACLKRCCSTARLADSGREVIKARRPVPGPGSAAHWCVWPASR
jgi:hypothetical protein